MVHPFVMPIESFCKTIRLYLVFRNINGKLKYLSKYFMLNVECETGLPILRVPRKRCHQREHSDILVDRKGIVLVTE